MRTAPDESTERPRCRFCFPVAFAPAQLLLASPNFYVIVPRGQAVEGHLAIYTHRCGDRARRLRCLDDLRETEVAELAQVADVVQAFYRAIYRSGALFYEHGRGGGSERADPTEGHGYHPHLCALPIDVDVGTLLGPRFSGSRAVALPHIREQIGARPYLFVSAADDRSATVGKAYYDRQGEQALRAWSLKRALAESLGLEGQWDWRLDDNREWLAAVAAKFDAWYAQ